MKKYLYVCLAFLFTASVFFLQTGDVSADNPKTTTQLVTESNTSISNLSSESTISDGGYVVTFKTGISIKQMKATIKQYDGKIVDDRLHIQMAKIYLSKNQYNKMKHDHNVEIIEKNQILHPLNNGNSEQYSHALTNISNAWNQEFRAEGIDIAVLDSGASSHSDLNIAGGYSAVNYTSFYNDDNGHGTHVAGIIASKDNGQGTVGVASKANIYAVKVLQYTGKSELMDTVDGLDWAIKKGVDIINISLGTEKRSATLKAKVDEAIEKGIIVVAAAGNTGDTNIYYPAKYDGVVAVGATDSNNQLAPFSSRGDELDIVAPGVSIISTFLNYTYERASGTSQAAPYVSGMMALLKEQYPNKSSNELIQILYDNALDLGVKGKDPLYGYGLVQYPKGEKPDVDDDNDKEDKENPDAPDRLNYSDVKQGDSHYSGIEWLSNKGIQGYDDGTFGVNRDLTRPHAAIMFTRALDLNIPASKTVVNYFDDVSIDHVYAKFIGATGKAGIFKGSNGMFMPNKKLTREQMASTIVNAYDLKLTREHTKINLKNVDESHKQSVQVLADLGITNQVDDFRPKEIVTRGQFATFLYLASKKQ